jgi:hypothetical protein
MIMIQLFLIPVLRTRFYFGQTFFDDIRGGLDAVLQPLNEVLVTLISAIGELDNGRMVPIDWNVIGHIGAA